jgi:hypothetical protein
LLYPFYHTALNINKYHTYISANISLSQYSSV